MKILFVLLAALAVANANSYTHCGCKRFLVYPKPQAFCYHIQYKSCWCSYKYYEPVLHVYPGKDCGTLGWTETPIEDLQTEMENLLKESLLEITKTMALRKVVFVRQLTKTADEYKEEYKKNITRYYAYYIASVDSILRKEHLIKERNDLIEEYNEQLNQKVTVAVEKCTMDILAKITTIAVYHKKLVKSAVGCLETREQKIEEYITALENQCKLYVGRFVSKHLAILEQNKKYYRATLAKVHGSALWKKAKVDAVIEVYHEQEAKKISVLANEYAATLNTCKAKLITNYRCAYKCYMSNSCLRFYKKTYYSYCRNLGCWYKYTPSYCVVRKTLCPFYYPYKPISFSCLRTCVFPAVVRNGATIIKELEEKLGKAIKEYVVIFTAWKTKWVQYHTEYCDKYNEILKERHEWYIRRVIARFVVENNSTELTTFQKAEIAKLKKELNERRTEAVLTYKKKLLNLLLECVAKFNENVEEYKEKALNLIKGIAKAFDACLTKRKTDILAYRFKMIKHSFSEKEIMRKDMIKSKLVHLGRYKEMLKTYHDGEEFPEEVDAMIEAYEDKLENYCEDILEECTKDWSAAIPKLTHHYACSYTCREGRFCMPKFCFGGYFRWVVKYPTAKCYTYYYRCYRTTCNYRVFYQKGCYRYGCH
ncbi:endostyle-specific [Ciona intestinalis]